MLRLGEGVKVEEVAGPLDDAVVGGCTELLDDVATLDTELIKMEILDMLALPDDDTRL